MPGNQTANNFLKLATVLDIRKGNTAMPGYQTAHGEIGHILIMDDPRREKIALEDDRLAESDLPKNDHRHAQNGESKDYGVDGVWKDRMGGDRHVNKENTGDYSNWIEKDRHPDS